MKERSRCRMTAMSTAISAGLMSFQLPALAESLQLEEVVVTAQKRAESVQDIPVAITAISAETLENMGLNSFEDLTKVSPSLTITENNNKNENPIALRGIGTFSFSIGVEPSVAVVIDEIPVARSGGAFNNLADIERIEVLRGPQSTLFGKNASAGVINIVTKDPSEDLETTFEVSATDDNEYRTSGAVSGMLTDNLGARLSAYYGDREGHINNLTDGSKLNGSVSKGARAKVVWDASDALKATFIGEYNNSVDHCCVRPFRYVSPDAQQLGFIPQSDWLPGITPSDTNTNVRMDGSHRSDSSDWLASVKLDYDLGEYTISSITGYRNWDYKWAIDFDFTDAFTLNQAGPYNTTQLTQEIRVTSPASDILEYVAGLYYTDTKNERSFERGPVFASKWTGTADSETYAVFGQGKWTLTDDLSLITGLRYHHEKISTSFDDQLPDRSCSTGCVGSADDDVILGKLALQYFTSDDVMFFGSYTRGYKGQAFDIASSFNQDSADNPVKAETSDAFELGVKSTLFDNRVQLNATLFLNSYTDFQAQGGRVLDDGNIEVKLNNVGDLETKGLELDAVGLVTENFQVNVGLAYTNATIKEFKGADCYPGQTLAQGCAPINPAVPSSRPVQDLSGKDLSNSPDWKLTLGGDYQIPLASMSFDGFLNFSYKWQDEVNFSLANSPLTVEDSYGVFNLSAGIVSKDDSYKLTVFVNNLFDKNYVDGIADVRFLFGNEPVLVHNIPRSADRYMGVRLKVNF